MWNTKVIIKRSVAQSRYTTALVRGNTETRNGKADTHHPVKASYDALKYVLFA